MATPDRAEFRRRPSTIERRLGPEVLVIVGGETEPRRLSGPAALTWEALAEPGSHAAVVSRLEGLAPAGADVDAAIDQGLTALRDAGLVELVEPPEAR